MPIKNWQPCYRPMIILQGWLPITQLIDHYVKTWGALQAGGHLMVIDTLAAQNLINKYFES